MFGVKFTSPKAAKAWARVGICLLCACYMALWIGFNSAIASYLPESEPWWLAYLTVLQVPLVWAIGSSIWKYRKEE